MDEAAFEALARKAEADAQANMTLYKWRLRGWAILGYLAIFGALALVITLIGGTVAVAFFSSALFLLLLKSKVIFVALPALWILLRALWVRFPAPTGYPLTREAVPKLYEELDALSGTLAAARVDQVLLTPELNAAVTQTPRLGIFGWQRNTLILGLELLLTLTPTQARAVVAHELGHLSGNHSAFNGWIYRVRQSWQHVMEAFEAQQSIGGRLMGWFFNWYAPRFGAYSFALAQRNEYEADAVAAELTSAEDAGAALVNVTVTAPHIDEHYWHSFFKQADLQPQPPHLPWSGLNRYVAGQQLSNLSDSLEQNLEVETGYADTHPALKDRLAALGVTPAVPAPTHESAAEAWFGEQLQIILQEFDEDWLSAQEERWKARYDYVVESRAALEDLQAKTTADLTSEELWRRAMLLEEFESRPDAIAAIEDYRRKEPDDVDGTFVLARNLAFEGDDRCLALLEEAVAAPRLAIDSCRLALWFCREHEREQDFAVWNQRFDEVFEAHQARMHAHQQLTTDDQLIPTDLTLEEADNIVNQLKTIKFIKAAWIAEKVFDDDFGVKGYAVAVKSKGIFVDEERVASKLKAHMEDFDIWLIPLHGESKKLAKRIVEAGTQII